MINGLILQISEVSTKGQITKLEMCRTPIHEILLVFLNKSETILI